ncbi:hypothetical protein [Spiribacter roseus]|uniref:Oligosaccharide repeat unit polymerase n=1 Tax=Spiribacter roseus TaxID=1855875 RepID=A0ABV3RX63_9GAMM
MNYHAYASLNRCGITAKPKRHIKVSRFLSFVIYFLGLLSLMAPSDSSLRWAGVVFVVSLQLIRIARKNRLDSLEVALGLTAVLLFCVPGVFIKYSYGIDVIVSFLSFFLATDFMLFSQRKIGDKKVIHSGPRKISTRLRLQLYLSFILGWCVLASIFLDADGFLGLTLFVIPYSVSLLFLEGLLAHGITRRAIFAWLLVYAAVVAIYLIYSWNGFGRLVVGAFLLAPVLVVNSKIDIYLRGWLLVLSAPILLGVAQFSRYGGIASLNQWFGGSAGHHYVVTHDAWEFEISQIAGGVIPFLEQFLLFFLNWLPSGWWEEKPVGIGSYSVELMYDPSGFSSGYSQSVGFLGELYLTLGAFAVFGLIFILSVLSFLRFIVHRFSFGSIVPLVIFDVNIISYFWGGMATFGSRFWFMIIPTICVLWFLRSRASTRNLSV